MPAYRPVFLAFGAATLGAAVVALALSFAGGRAEWLALLLGAVSTAAMTGLIASGIQFLPNRHYSAVTVLSAIVVGLAVNVLLRAGETTMGLGRVPAATVVVWAAAVILSLIVTRESARRLPPVERPPQH
jgi:hypothetical protein